MAPESSIPGYGQSASLRRRGVSFTLAALANLLLLMLFTLAPGANPPVRRETPPTKVTLLPNVVALANDAAATDRANERRPSAARPRPRPVRQTPVPPASTPPPDLPPPPLNMILMDRKSFAATDISRLPAAPANTSMNGTADSGADHVGDSRLAGGTGPGGETLYRAEWYRRPSNADLAGYGFSRGPGPGWGEIACRTAPGYRVEACVEYAQSPGSGLAGVVRDAASRFRVRPPRIGGRPLVGGWVLIHIDYTEKDGG